MCNNKKNFEHCGVVSTADLPWYMEGWSRLWGGVYNLWFLGFCCWSRWSAWVVHGWSTGAAVRRLIRSVAWLLEAAVWTAHWAAGGGTWWLADGLCNWLASWKWYKRDIRYIKVKDMSKIVISSITRFKLHNRLKKVQLLQELSTSNCLSCSVWSGIDALHYIKMLIRSFVYLCSISTFVFPNIFSFSLH